MKIYANLLSGSSNFPCDMLMSYDTKHFGELSTVKLHYGAFTTKNTLWFNNSGIGCMRTALSNPRHTLERAQAATF